MEKTAFIQVTLDASDEEIDISGNVTQMDDFTVQESRSWENIK